MFCALRSPGQEIIYRFRPHVSFSCTMRLLLKWQHRLTSSTLPVAFISWLLWDVFHTKSLSRKFIKLAQGQLSSFIANKAAKNVFNETRTFFSSTQNHKCKSSIVWRQDIIVVCCVPCFINPIFRLLNKQQIFLCFRALSDVCCAARKKAIKLDKQQIAD